MSKMNLTEKFNQYLKLFGNVLTTDGNRLLCRACDREITKACKKYSVIQHFNTQTHIQAMDRFNDNKQDCDQLIVESNSKSVKTVTKINSSLRKKHKKYIEHYGEVLTTSGDKLICQACNQEITNTMNNYSVDQHFKSLIHVNIMNQFYTNNCIQIDFDSFLSDINGNLPEKEIILRKKHKKYAEMFGQILTIDGNRLVCRVCDREITNSLKKYSVDQHLRSITHIHFMNEYFSDNFHKNIVETEPKQLNCSLKSNENAVKNVYLRKKHERYIEIFGDILTINENRLICQACDREITNSSKKYSVDQHFKSHAHINAINEYYSNSNIDPNRIKLNFYENPNKSDVEKREYLMKKHEKYIEIYGNILTTDDNKLICRACDREISRSFKKYSVVQHFNTQTHIYAAKEFITSGKGIQKGFNEESLYELNELSNNNSEQDLIQNLMDLEPILIKTEVDPFIVENDSENDVNEDFSDTHMISSDDSFCMNNKLKTDTNMSEFFDKILEKVKLLLVECNCGQNSVLKTDIKLLLSEYELKYKITEERNEDLNQSLSIGSENIIKTMVKDFVFGNELFASKVKNSNNMTSNISEDSIEKCVPKKSKGKLKKIKCNKCEKMFTTSKSVLIHKVRVHRNQNNNNKSNFQYNSNNKLQKTKTTDEKNCTQNIININLVQEKQN